jgi:hypothetical protein
MKTVPYVIGVTISALVLFFAYTDGGFHSHTTFYSAAMASSFIVYSSIAFLVSRFGSRKQSKAWLFFVCGIALMFAFIPSFRFVVDLFYVERFRGMDSGDPLPVIRELFYYGPVIIGSLCVFRAISLWSDENTERKEPNQ